MASYGSPLFVSSFDKDTPVLRLNYGKDPNVRWVLWPVYAWRVVAPTPTERKLNLFQRAVLGLARAGITRAVDISERLLIAVDLAGLVVLELQNMGLLDFDGAPTERGLKMLDEIEEDPPDKLHVGHVLSDPFTGRLWPRFLLGDLPIADVEPNDKGWPVLLSGSAGDPWRDRTFCLLPGQRGAAFTSRPSPREVLRAARRHRRQRSLMDVHDDHDVPALQRVSFVEDRPHPYLMALKVCRHPSGDWMVQDPFGHGESVALRAAMEERLDQHDGLRRWLAPLVGVEPEAPTLGHLQAQAKWDVEERLTVAIQQHPSVYERLIAMQRALLEASSDDAPADKWDDILVKAQRSIERMLSVLHEPYVGVRPPYFLELDRDVPLSREKVNAAAAEVGFKTPLPQTLSSVRRGKVQNAEQSRRGSLRPLLLLALLAARWKEEHPLRRAAVSHPDLLVRLDALATARDRAAHDGAETFSERVSLHVETTFVAVQSLLLSN
jgi:hypothetical protein